MWSCGHVVSLMSYRKPRYEATIIFDVFTEIWIIIIITEYFWITGPNVKHSQNKSEQDNKITFYSLNQLMYLMYFSPGGFFEI